MEEFITEFWLVLKELLPYVAALVTAITSYLIFRINDKTHKEKEKALTDALEQARSKETYTICPKCGEKLPLSKINFYLPGELLDNNLNGVPDEREI